MLAHRWVGRHSDSSRSRPHAELDLGTDTLPEIKSIVVLMMENHSYDNYLGMLQGRGDGYALGANGLPGDPHSNRTSSGQAVPLTHAPSTRQHDGVPSQSWAASHIQWNGGACDGFVRSTEETLNSTHVTDGMAYWTEEDLPFYYGLAKTFPLATRWFSSCLGPTFPNRRFLVSGTANGLIDDVASGLTDYPAAGTIFDRLTAHGISWTNYHNKSRAKTVLKSLLGKRGLSVGRYLNLVLAGLVPGFEQFAIGELQFSADMYPRGLLRTVNHAKSIEQFFEDAQAGNLPSVSIIDPDYGNFSEEDPQDVRVGESFAHDVINAVMSGKGWPNTVLFWLYDEHGGYYDHVPPPEAPAPDDVPAQSIPERHPWLRRLPFLKKKFAELDVADNGPRTYDRYGFRVPAVIVSPYARPDFVTDTVYDHTSVLKLIEQKWNFPPMTRRDAAATSPIEALDLESSPAFLVPPKLSPPASPGAWKEYLK